MSDCLNKALILSFFMHLHQLVILLSYFGYNKFSFCFMLTVRVKTKSVKYFIFNISWELEIKNFSKSNYILFLRICVIWWRKTSKNLYNQNYTKKRCCFSYRMSLRHILNFCRVWKQKFFKIQLIIAISMKW